MKKILLFFLFLNLAGKPNQVTISIHLPSINTEQKNIGIHNAEKITSTLSPISNIQFDEKNVIPSPKKTPSSNSFCDNFFLLKYKSHILFFLIGLSIGYNKSFLLNFIKKIFFKKSFINGFKNIFLM